MGSFLLSALLLLSTPSFAAEPVASELSLSGGVFYALGASNTHGFNLNVGLRDRVLAHLKLNNPKVLDALKAKKACFGLTIDRFFPTAFPALGMLESAKLEKAVEGIVADLLAPGCTVVVVDLLDPATLTQDQSALVDKHEPLTLVKKALLVADMKGTGISVVNKTLVKLAATNPKLIVKSFNGEIENLLSAGNLDGRPFEALFQNDGMDVHVNYSGQAHLFNIYGREELSKVAGIEVSAIAFEKSYTEAWEKRVLAAAASLSPDVKFSASVQNLTDLTKDKYQITGAKRKGVLTVAGDLKLIDKVVRDVFKKDSVKFPVIKRRVRDSVVYEVDFTNMAYMPIVLHPSKKNPKVYIGYGTDYWGYAIGFTRLRSKALTTYVFELTEVDEQNVKIVWKILPQLQIGKEVQKISSSERMAEIKETKWIEEIEANISDYDRLEYPLETRLEKLN